MTCYVQKCLTDHDLLPKHAQNLEDKERKKHISNLIRFFFSIFFIQNKISSYFEKETEEKYVFGIFLEIQNTFFFTSQKSNFRILTMS